MRFIIVRPEVQAWLRTAGWAPEGAGTMKEAVDVAVFDRHREFEQFDHLKEGASSRNSMLESVSHCDKFL